MKAFILVVVCLCTFFSYAQAAIASNPMINQLPTIYEEDPPKPVPTSCIIRFNRVLGALGGWWVICFYKDGNQVASYFYDERKHIIYVDIDPFEFKTYAFDERNPSVIADDFPLDLNEDMGLVKEILHPAKVCTIL